MILKKHGGKIYGATLTADEKKAVRMEIQRELVEYNKKNNQELDALILWHLHEEFGFGKKRLRRFYESFFPALKALAERYELDDSDRVWICSYRLKEYGIDLDEWYEEVVKKDEK